MKNVKVFRKLLILSILSSFALVICSTDFYRAALAQGTWQTKASTPTPIAQSAVGVVNGKLYSVGGASAAICCNTQSAPTFAYDPATDTWATRTSMSVRRKNLAAGVVNGVLYAIGGDNDFSAFATNEAYDPATDTWTARAPMPTPRTSPSIGVVNGILYVIGGENSAGPLTTVEAYDPVTNTWTTKAPMLHARSRGHAAVGVNGMLYAIGGFDTSAAILATVEAYDPVANIWISRASMPTARNGLAAAAVNGIIYAIGGNNGGILSTVEAYDPVTDTWTTMPSMPTARDSLGAAEINGVVYAVGGGVSHAPPIITATVEAFTPSPPTCTQPPTIAGCAAGKTLSSDASCRAAIPDLTGEVSATSNCPSSSPLAITQSPAAGTLVGLGDTTVTMTVKDSRGNASTCTARITVVDTTPPAITCSPDLTLIANLGSNSSVVTYAAPTATDNCTVATVACSPASGSSFSVGATTVTCAATDSSGNTASCAFTVTVLSPQQATQSLINNVNNLVSQGTLNQGQGNALTSKLDAAIQKMNQGNGNAASNQLQAFINQVNALINSGRLTPSQGQALIDAANNLIAHLP